MELSDIVSVLFNMLDAERTEVKRLTNILLQNAGAIAPADTTVHIESSVDKIKLGGNHNIRDILFALEREHKIGKDADFELVDIPTKI